MKKINSITSKYVLVNKKEYEKLKLSVQEIKIKLNELILTALNLFVCYFILGAITYFLLGFIGVMVMIILIILIFIYAIYYCKMKSSHNAPYAPFSHRENTDDN